MIWVTSLVIKLVKPGMLNEKAICKVEGLRREHTRIFTQGA